MPLAWPRPLPLIILAAPLLLMWAPARAFLGAAVSRLPSGTRLLAQSVQRKRRGGAAGQPRLSCSTMAAPAESGSGDRAEKVIVITGPTATGKSSIALALCKSLGGEIVSCDSVQVYTDVCIGCNKPSDLEMREVRHHLVDVASLDETFTAGEFLNRAQEAIDDILARGRVPVVVGGTMMYVHWLVHGKPDAPKKDPVVAQAVATELLPFQEREDWDGALQILAAANETRAASLCRNDWYRLSRSLEVLRGPSGQEAYMGVRKPPRKKYDFRTFFIMGDRERLFRRIDRRCEEMLRRGLLAETAGLLMRGMLDPASPAGRAIGYRQTIDFLHQEAGLTGGNETDASSAGVGGAGEETADPEARFLQFYMTFAARTRQYAGEQMKWFRSPKGHDFSWQAWDLGGPIKEVERRGEAARRRSGRGASSSGPVAWAGDGRSWQDAAASIAESYKLSRKGFEEELDGEYQMSLRAENQMRAKDMKRYVPGVSLLGDGETLSSLVRDTNHLAKRLREAKLERQAAVGAGVEEGVKGWNAGSR